MKGNPARLSACKWTRSAAATAECRAARQRPGCMKWQTSLAARPIFDFSLSVRGASLRLALQQDQLSQTFPPFYVFYEVPAVEEEKSAFCLPIAK